MGAAGPVAGSAVAHVAYGPNAQQRMDIYVPDRAQAAPVLFLVHGGGWRRGDKAHDRLVQNKLAHWAAQGGAGVGEPPHVASRPGPTHRPAMSPWRCPMRSNRHTAGVGMRGALCSWGIPPVHIWWRCWRCRPSACARQGAAGAGHRGV